MRVTFDPNDFPKNFSMTFEKNFVRFRYSLNVPVELVPYLPAQRVTRGTKFWVYWVSGQRESVTGDGISKTYESLKWLAQKGVSDAKAKMYKDKAIKLKDYKDPKQLNLFQ